MEDELERARADAATWELRARTAERERDEARTEFTLCEQKLASAYEKVRRLVVDCAATHYVRRGGAVTTKGTDDE